MIDTQVCTIYRVCTEVEREVPNELDPQATNEEFEQALIPPEEESSPLTVHSSLSMVNGLADAGVLDNALSDSIRVVWPSPVLSSLLIFSVTQYIRNLN